MADSDEYRSDPTDDALDEAATLLKKLGLTEYAARTFLALQRLDGGTAREVSETSEVPRTKVYDVMDELEEVGLVEVRRSNPQAYIPATTETTRRTFQREYESAVSRLFEILSGLPPVEGDHKIDGIWVVSGEAALHDRMRDLIESAEESVLYVVADGGMPDRVVERLTEAAGTGRSVTVAGLDDPAAEGFDAKGSSIEFVESPDLWTDSTVHSVLLVDRNAILLVVPDAENGGRLSGLWGRGERNMLVAAFEPVVRAWLDTDDGIP